MLESRQCWMSSSIASGSGAVQIHWQASTSSGRLNASTPSPAPRSGDTSHGSSTVAELGCCVPRIQGYWLQLISERGLQGRRSERREQEALENRKGEPERSMVRSRIIANKYGSESLQCPTFSSSKSFGLFNCSGR
ncbi:hypothetical protein NE237_018880 [Protea cynaroides]|uniref:Uncharacterized protein n=1 Tax=Protea cynaroides TaxID=273540 RepID=A0A9Q0KAP8_9MAGN|nr:hypothetical protein NE237_018880 [Protea cynaroides]